MKLIIQRVSYATVSANKKKIGSIGSGLFVLLGVGKKDSEEDVEYLADKLVKLRVMADDRGKMNLSIKDTDAEVLVVSQFTLYANTDNGNRPSFVNAAEPKVAKVLYEKFITKLKDYGVKVSTGKFGEHMKIILELDGPVTITLEK